ncbi:hypothetical protein P3X46_023485 [Hevea brasiliensis]|uniref:DELLA protein n=1 Tax=Hevea brasiliensis TaxID=3981 RepID=A0ABQ9LET6_HEVBR|nr:hypothetical protein P3X46_023485 [Hevea brasiliensis]
MSPGLFLSEFSKDETVNRMGSVDLSLSAMAYYPCPYLPALEDNRIKQTLSFAESIGSNSGFYCVGSNNSDRSISRSSSTNSLKAAVAIINAEEGGNDDESTDGMRLVQLLITCVEAVAYRDKSHASALLSELRSSVLVFGSSFQRVASCFVQGIADRLSLVQPLGIVGFIAPMMNIMDISCDKKEETLRFVYEIFPHIQFANTSILEAFEGESFVHVVDLGMTLGLPHGHPWRQLIQSLASRLCVGRFQTIGDELMKYAKDLGINLEFWMLESNLENLRPDDIKVFDGEVLVVNSIFQLLCDLWNSVLQMIHALSPKVLVLVEQDSSHNGPFFLGRFMEALHYYSAIFDSLDAMLPRYDNRRAKNIVSCEASAKVERLEKVVQWRRRMSRANQWLGKNKVCDGYTVVEEKGCLVLGWKSKPIIAASC